MPDPTQTIASSFQWGQRFDLMRRQGAASISVTPADQLLIVQTVSAFAYRYAFWPFTLEVTPQGSIQCQNLVQDYSAPPDLYRIARAWFYVPTATNSINYGTVPPYDDPSLAAYAAAQLSAAFVGSQTGGGTPAGIAWPLDGSFDVVKRLPVNTFPYYYTQIHSITQQPNNGLIRLSAATAVSDSQPYSLEMEYQPVRPPVNALTEYLWMPDDYTMLADEGILYYLYRFNNDPRAGVAVYASDGAVSYTGQYATWMAALESAAAAERAGSVNFITPSQSLGSGNTEYGLGGWF